MRHFTFPKASLFSFLIIPFMVFATPPSDVQNLSGTAGDGSVDLTWDAAEDDGVILGYKVYYGTTSIEDMGEDEYYSEEVLTDSSDTNYTVEGLSNGVTYYFAVTALDEEETESESYSNEVSVTPSSEMIDTPSVISARQISDTEIEVVMSKPVVVKSVTQAFQIMDEGSLTEVSVEDIEVEGTYVYITVSPGSLQVGNVYNVTATSAVEDLSGNPVSSGITDTVSFTAGSSSSDETVDEEPIVDVNDDFFVDDEDTSGGILDIPTDDYGVGHGAATEVDRLPPGDATSLKINTDKLAKNGTVVLSWEPAFDRDGDIVDQKLYIKEGTKNWDNGYSLGRNIRTETITVKKNENYRIRLVTVDRSGNESNGVILNFSTSLTKAGPATIYLFGGAFVLVTLFFVFGRKKA